MTGWSRLGAAVCAASIVWWSLPQAAEARGLSCGFVGQSKLYKDAGRCGAGPRRSPGSRVAWPETGALGVPPSTTTGGVPTTGALNIWPNRNAPEKTKTKRPKLDDLGDVPEKEVVPAPKMGLLANVTQALQTPLNITWPPRVEAVVRAVPVFLGGVVTGVVGIAVGSVFVFNSLAISPAAIEAIGENSGVFTETLTSIVSNYVEEVDSKRLTETAIEAMLASLDPYTEFEGAQENQRLMESIQGRYGGVGLVISGKTAAEDKADEITDSMTGELSPSSSKKIVVMDAFENYAFDAGFRVGDEIFEIDGINVEGQTVEQVSSLLRGTPDTKVKVKFRRNVADAPKEGFEIELQRRVIRVPTVRVQTLLPAAEAGGKPVGYIQLGSFGSTSAFEVSQAYQSLDARAKGGLEGIILDLRGNPGGLLDQAVDVTSMFVPKDNLIVAAKGRTFPSVRYASRDDPIRPMSLPLVVLVDAGSASASEIVSGAIQDLDAGVVVGPSKTYGKGLVQSVQPVGDGSTGSSIKYTVAKYYTPSGRCIQSVNYKEGNKQSNGGNGGYESSKVKDEDRKEFRTKAGRTVLDGGGIEPDVIVKQPKAGALEYALLEQGLYFDYAGKWAKEHPNGLPSNPKEVVTNDVYRDFESFVRRRQQEATEAAEKIKVKAEGQASATAVPAPRPPPRIEDVFGRLDIISKDGVFDASDEELATLRSTLSKQMLNDFKTHESEIRKNLRGFILSRYLPSSMVAEQSLSTDDQVAEAITIVKDQKRYRKILSPPETLPTRQEIAAEDAKILIGCVQVSEGDTLQQKCSTY